MLQGNILRLIEEARSLAENDEPSELMLTKLPGSCSFESNLCRKYGDIGHSDSVRSFDMCFKDRSSPKSTID